MDGELSRLAGVTRFAARGSHFCHVTLFQKILNSLAPVMVTMAHLAAPFTGKAALPSGPAQGPSRNRAPPAHAAAAMWPTQPGQARTDNATFLAFPGPAGKDL